jgi:hypothetical protein
MPCPSHPPWLYHSYYTWTSYEASHYAVFSTLLSLHPSLAQILSSVQTLWPLVHKRTIPTERPSLVGQILQIERCRVVSAVNPPRSLISVF